MYPLLPLGEVSINYDTQRIPVKETDRKRGQYPYYGASGIVDYIDGYLFDGEYLLIAEDGENLRSRKTPVAFRAKGKFWVNNHAHIIQGNEKALTRYLEYAVNLADIGSYLTGSTMPKLTQGNLNRLPIVTPPVEIQRSIVQIIGDIDDKIELNEKINKDLESMALAIFKEWFVDFGPTKSKAEGKKPFGINDETALFFPNRFEVSEFGPIPEGWKVGFYRDLMSQTKETVAPDKYEFETCYHYSLPNYDFGKFPLEEKIDEIKSNKFRVSTNSILFSKLNPRTPRVWLPLHEPSDDIKCLGSTEFVVIKPLNPINRWLAYCLLKEETFLDRMAQTATGTSNSHQRIKPENIFEQRVVLPPFEIFEAFYREASVLFELILNNQREIQILRTARNLILPKLISGELELK